jgi:addiction module HigA family antidote
MDVIPSGARNLALALQLGYARANQSEILREEFMKPLGLSMNKLALDLRVPVTRIAEIVHERRAISTDTALRLGRYFNTTPVFWMNLQVRYDLEVAEDELVDRIARDVQPIEAAALQEVGRLPSPCALGGANQIRGE